MRLSDAMVRMLRDAATGNAFASLRGRSAHGGAFGTTVALIRRGLMDRDYKLTAAGLEYLRQLEGS